MASLSRLVLNDCKLGTYDAMFRPSSSFPARKLQTFLGMFYFVLIVCGAHGFLFFDLLFGKFGVLGSMKIDFF